ncbi:MAG: formate dehydrogenase accessory sulfurtransferase FdhD [Gemmatimonadetes bacterium]|nr:formate dehydrogenase accessory sulfurtransferase FdhD [Gemmatimonadota bacterium]
MKDAVRSVTVTRVEGGDRTIVRDRAASEEPMEIRLNGEPFAVIMRTPGADAELAAGFLFSERVVRGSLEIGTIEHCGRRGDRGGANVVDVRIIGRARRRLPRMIATRRQVVANSSCGLCGRLTIDSLRVESPRVAARWTIDADRLASLPGRLRRAQSAFDETGGLHAAGLFTLDGQVAGFAEDVGRHNAVDKVVGRMLITDRLPLTRTVLVVSGRASFEIVQKAFLAGIPVVAAVSAPSTLAIDLAHRAGMTLVGFVRGHRFNIYTHARRVKE